MSIVKRKVNIAGFFCLMLSHSTFATTIVETWTANLSGYTGIAASGATLNWTVTYDNASTTMHAYDDGPNGIAERGAGDDFAHTSWSIQNDTGFGFLADSYSTLGDSWDTLTGWSENFQTIDFKTENFDQRFLIYATDNVQNQFANEYIYGNAYFGNTDPSLSGGTIWAHSTSGVARSNLYNVSMTAQSVSEPTTLILLGIGIISIAGLHRKTAITAS